MFVRVDARSCCARRWSVPVLDPPGYGGERPRRRAREATGVTDGAGARSVEGSAVEQLQRDLLDAREEIVATNAVLTAMGRSASDLDLVFGAIVDSARNLCRADAAVLTLVDGPHYRLARSSGVSADYVQHMIDHPFRRDAHSLQRPGRSRAARHPDRRRARRPQLRPAGRPADRRLSHDHGRADAARRRRHRRADGLAHRSRSVRGSGHHAPHRVRVGGGDRRAQPRPRARAGGPHRRARPQGRPVGGARQARGGGQLEPRPRHRAVDDRHARRPDVGHRRWLVDGVRRGRAALLRAHGVRDERRDARSIAQRRDLAPRHVRRPRRAGGAAAADRRPGVDWNWTSISGRSSTPAGGRWWPYRCSARVRSSASSWCGG